MGEMLSVEEVANLFHLHEMTVRRHIRQGKLKAFRVGGRIRVRKEDIERFMRPIPAAKTVVPTVLPPSEAEIARRRSLFNQAMRLREHIGPIGITADELVRKGRLEEDTSYA